MNTKRYKVKKILKQLLSGVLQNSLSEKFCNIYKKTTVTGSTINTKESLPGRCFSAIFLEGLF